MDFEACNIPVRMLKPSQEDLDLEKVFSALSGDASRYMISPVQLVDPIVTFNGEYIIDGHHRWARIFMMNPDAEVSCLDFQSNESLNEFLDRFDGAKASKEKIKSPLRKFIKKDKKQARKEINEKLEESVVDQLLEYDKINDSRDCGSYNVGRAVAISYIYDNLKRLAKQKPPKNSAKRKDMPQLTAKEAYLDENEEFWDYKTGDITDKNLFDTRKTGTGLDSYLSDPEYFAKKFGQEAVIVEMTPLQYFEECAKGFNNTVESQKRQVEGDKQILNHLNTVIDKYKKQFPITYLRFNGPSFGQEGRHRMYVAGERFGWNTKFPVLVIRDIPMKPFIKKVNSPNGKYVIGMNNRAWFYGNTIQELRDKLWSLEGTVNISYLSELDNLIWDIEETQDE